MALYPQLTRKNPVSSAHERSSCLKVLKAWSRNIEEIKTILPCILKELIYPQCEKTHCLTPNILVYFILSSGNLLIFVNKQCLNIKSFVIAWNALNTSWNMSRVEAAVQESYSIATTTMLACFATRWQNASYPSVTRNISCNTGKFPKHC